jgi:uncharacterized protein (TIGR03437 family)
LQVTVASGDKQLVASQPLRPVVARVVDRTKLPFSNQPLEVTVEGGGTVSPSSARTNEFGEASFTWAPGAGSFNRLAFRIPGVPESTGVAVALGKPAILNGGVVNGASFQGPIVPAGIASIFGGSLAGGARASATSTNFPTVLGGVRVSLNGTAAPLVYVSDSQINIVVPATILSGTAQMTVESALGTSDTFLVTVAAASPGIFLSGSAGAIVVAGTTSLTQARPAKPGEFLEIYCTGLGISPSATVTIGGVPALVTFAGMTVAQGLQQVNAQVPEGISPGSQALVLTVNGVQANSVAVEIGVGP